MAKKNIQLTEEIVAPGGARKVFVTLALCVLGVVFANFAAQRALSAHPMNRGYWLIREKWSRLAQLDQPVDWLLLGDSSCNQGVRPDVFDPLMGGASVNLCTIADTLVIDDAWMLETYLARWGKPKGGVVIVHVYDEWYREITRTPKILARIPLPWGFWDRMLPRLPLGPKQEAAMFVAREVPLYAENASLADWIMPGARAVQRFHVDERGYMANEVADPDLVRSDTEEHLRFVRANRFALSRVNERSLQQIADRAAEQDFDVYVASSPLYEGLRRSKDFDVYFADVQRTLEAFAAMHPRVHFVLEEPVTFSASEMENADHLTHAAAAIYTRRLAEAVRAARGAP